MGEAALRKEKGGEQESAKMRISPGILRGFAANRRPQAKPQRFADQDCGGKNDLSRPRRWPTRGSHLDNQGLEAGKQRGFGTEMHERSIW